MRVLTPTSLDHALELLDEHRTEQVRPVAGGTDLLVSWHHHDKSDWTLLDLSPLAGELRSMQFADECLELGPLVTYWDVIRDDQVSGSFPLLREAARQVGAVQIQTRGTWAGNIANGSPAADGVPVMMAYDASVVLASKSGRRQVSLDSYYTGYRKSVKRPDELIVSIRLPRRERDVEWFCKVGPRAAQAITKVGVALTHDAAGWRVVVNSVAPTVLRCTALEQALDAGATFADPCEISALLQRDIAPIDDMRSTAEYRGEALARLLHHALSEPPMIRACSA